MLLNIGTRSDGKVMTIPADLGDKKIALVAQSNKGKTYGLGDILEELCKARRPFIATDPANNLWGLRVRPDGSPSGLPVVIIGGPNADIPLEKDAGDRVAEALISSPQCAVIDTSMETGGTKRRFMTDFAQRLIRTRCDVPMPIFLEEAPDLIPQRAVGPQMEICKAAISKLATIGGNFGYGVFPATQRPATLDKDVLSQCEALIVMGITHTPDRKTIQAWVEAKDIGGRVDAMFAELGSLKPGEAWLWWPGEDRFERFTFRKRETLHPREMKKLGLKHAAVQLGDAQTFVERLKRQLTKTQVAVPEATGAFHKKANRAVDHVDKATRHPLSDQAAQHANAEAEVERLRTRVLELEALVEDKQRENAGLRHEAAEANRRLEAVRQMLRPQYDSLRTLFEKIGEARGPAAADRTVWEPWLSKAGQRGCKRMLEVLIERGELTRNQLGTLSNVASTKSTFRNYLSWLRSNGLVEVEKDMIRLRAV